METLVVFDSSGHICTPTNTPVCPGSFLHKNKYYQWLLSGTTTVMFCNLMFIGPCIIVIVEEWKTNLMSLAILFHFLCAQHVSDINISIIRSLRLCWWITTSVVLFSVRCVLELLMMDTLMSETCWAHKKWNKIASDIKLVFHSSTMFCNVSS